VRNPVHEPGKGIPRLSKRTVLALVLVAVLVAVAVAVVLVTRSADRSTEGISADELSEGTEETLETEVGARPNVSCPEGIEAEVGATARCTLSVGDDPAEYGVAVAVTSVDGDNFTVDVQVDEEPVG
jgi:hypothetical protein